MAEGPEPNGPPGAKQKDVSILRHRRWPSHSPCPIFKKVFAPLFSKSGRFPTKHKHIMR
jgi:hypothetical protein